MFAKIEPGKIELGEIAVDVVRKDIKNVHLSVYPPTGKVRISAPLRMDLDTIRVFAISKLGWIRQQQRKMREQEREPPREYLDRESHYVWGKRYLLKLIEKDAAPEVELQHSQIILRTRPATGGERKQEILEEWYRSQLKAAAPQVIAKWEPLIGVKVELFFVRKMKTKWGSCSPGTASIRLNTDLAKKPRECLEYIVVHEMAHLLEPTHNSRFLALMDGFLPQWRACRDALNRLPVRHERWGY
jgi:predicted metal-dependent hydrolase